LIKIIININLFDISIFTANIFEGMSRGRGGGLKYSSKIIYLAGIPFIKI